MLLTRMLTSLAHRNMLIDWLSCNPPPASPFMTDVEGKELYGSGNCSCEQKHLACDIMCSKHMCLHIASMCADSALRVHEVASSMSASLTQTGHLTVAAFCSQRCSPSPQSHLHL